MQEPDPQNGENGAIPQSVESGVRTALAQLARQRTPWRSQMTFAAPADAPGRYELGAPEAIGGVRLSKATGYAPGIVPEA